jgi:lipoyl(octanoyl) transferase
VTSLGLLKLGTIPYGQALAFQKTMRERLRRPREERDDDHIGYVVALEHPPVVTLGKRGSFDDLIDHRWLVDKGVEIFKIDRGGEATYHEPGQLVVYPIIRLDQLGMGVVDLIRGLAACLAETVATYGVESGYDCDHPGLWTTDEEPARKLGSVGMRVQGGVTTHGAAINLVNEMIGFSKIVACGMPNAPMARLADYCPERDLKLDAFRDDFLGRFEQFVEVELIPTGVELPAPDRWVQAATEWKA